MESLERRRDRSVGITNLAAIVLGSGIGVLGSALQFGDSTAHAGDGVGVASGAGSTLLSLVGVRLQRGGKRLVSIEPKMLAPVFHRGPDSVNVYPQDVWRYLNSAPKAGDLTPVDALVKHWTDEGRIRQDRSAATERKIDFLTSSFGGHRPLSIDDLMDRSAMLADLRARVALMKTNLSELTIYLRRAGI